MFFLRFRHMKTTVLRSLPAGVLKALAAAIKRGQFDAGINHGALAQAVGIGGADLATELGSLLAGGFTPSTLGVLLESMIAAREESADPADFFDLVLSGPDIPGIPVSDTSAVLHRLIESANERIELIGYAIHNGKILFERLAARMTECPSLSVHFCVDISRPRNDTSLDSEIVRRYARQFWEKQWPWIPRPRLFYDPRSLSTDLSSRSALHAKCLIVDGITAFITSANFTMAAQSRNIEAGVLVKRSTTAARLEAFFRQLRSVGILKEVIAPD
jgi:hypothetical protein